MPASKGNVRKRPSGSWQANWLDGFGVRRFKSFTKRKDADTFLNQVVAEADLVRAGVAPAIQAARGRHTWDDLIELWTTKKAAKISLRDDLGRIRLHLTPILGRDIVEGLDADAVTRVERELHRKVARRALSVATQRKVLILFQSMLKLAVRERWLTAAPIVEKPRAPVHERLWIAEAEAIVRLLGAARDEGYPGLAELYATAVATGLREGELIALDWDAVDLENGLITVKRVPTADQRGVRLGTKSGKVRYVPLPGDLVGLLCSWKASGYHPQIVFPNTRGERHRSDARVFKRNQIFGRCLEKAGIPSMTFHTLRHTFASHFVLRGGDVYVLQKVLGHQSVNTTQQYAHLAEGTFSRERTRMAGLIGGLGGARTSGEGR
ncbi:MAG: hypothetical protein RLZZ383_3036 [Pseudomonadota bacterium]